MQVIPVLHVSTKAGFTTGGNTKESESASTSSTGSGRKSDSKSTLRNVYPPIFKTGRKYIANKPPATSKAKRNVDVTLFFIVLTLKKRHKDNRFSTYATHVPNKKLPKLLTGFGSFYAYLNKRYKSMNDTQLGRFHKLDDVLNFRTIRNLLPDTDQRIVL